MGLLNNPLTRFATGPAGAVEAPQDVLNVGKHETPLGRTIGAPAKGLGYATRGVAETTATLSAVGAITAVDEISGADIVPESVKDTVLNTSRSAMQHIGEYSAEMAEKAYEAALNSLPDWIKAGIDMADYIPDFMSVSGQVVQYLISNLGENADNVVLLAQLSAAMIVSQTIASALGLLNIRRTKVDRYLTAGVKAAVAAVLGQEAMQAFNGQADLLGDVPIVASANQIEQMQADGHWLFDEPKRQTTWGYTALSTAGLAGLWAAWDGFKAKIGEVGLYQRRKGGWVDEIVRKKAPHETYVDTSNRLSCSGPDCPN